MDTQDTVILRISSGADDDPYSVLCITERYFREVIIPLYDKMIEEQVERGVGHYVHAD